MKEISPGLYIGSERDYESVVRHQDGWWVVHACKDPYHRQLLGYKGRGAPKGPHYYRVRHRPDVLTLNMVDVDDPAYISKEELIDPCLDFIQEGLNQGKKVLVHCNQGESRAPGIGMIYLLRDVNILPRTTVAEAEQAFLELYPGYQPKRGIRGFIHNYWNAYNSTWKERHAYHEAGHALVAVKHGRTPRYVDLWVAQRPEYPPEIMEDLKADKDMARHKEWMEKEIMISLSGRLGEKQAFGNFIREWSENDEYYAKDFARRTVGEDEKAEFVQDCWTAAERVIRENSDALETLAELLIREERISGERVQEIVEKDDPPTT